MFQGKYKIYQRKSRYRIEPVTALLLAQRRPTLTGGDPQLPSAQKSLTSVFGMGTGVASLPSSLDFFELVRSKLDKSTLGETCVSVGWLSPRSISIRQLHVSPRFHPEPIYLIVFEGSYLLAQWEISS